MKFYGVGIVWDGYKEKPLCRFVDGEYSTVDSREIAILKKLKYKNDEKIEPVVEAPKPVPAVKAKKAGTK